MLLVHNERMQRYLAENGIKCTPKYLKDGSLKGTWRLYDIQQRWTPELSNKLDSLGFKGFNGKPLNEYSGNGGMFCVFVRHYDLTAKFIPVCPECQRPR